MEHLSDEQLIGLYLKTLRLVKEDKDFKKMIEMELMKRDPLFKALDCSVIKLVSKWGRMPSIGLFYFEFFYDYYQLTN